MKMLKSKNIRRICVLLAMIAPAVYLFGSLFSGLAGSHGEQVFADVNEPYTVVYSGDDLFFGNYSYTTGNYSSSSGFLTTGLVSVEGVERIDFGGEVMASSQRYYVTYDENRAFVAGYQHFGTSALDSVVVHDAAFVAISFYSSASNAAHWENPSATFVYNDLAYSYSDYVFGQFFDKDNFLVKIGEDVLSETPHGFVPFASFWKYLDENMLHMGDMQLGLMGYGYVYYCCHVLLFDIAFILVTFFLDFIQKVNDKVVGGID